MEDDFYFNILDWSATNLLSVGLKKIVYLWNKMSKKIISIPARGAESNASQVTSVKWDTSGNILAIGFANGEVKLWDLMKQ